jgi:hypothetical protein
MRFAAQARQAMREKESAPTGNAFAAAFQRGRDLGDGEAEGEHLDGTKAPGDAAILLAGDGALQSAEVGPRELGALGRPSRQQRLEAVAGGKRTPGPDGVPGDIELGSDMADGVALGQPGDGVHALPGVAVVMALGQRMGEAGVDVGQRR